MLIKFIFATTDSPANKLADAELHFTDGPLAGLKIEGFAVWRSRGNARVNVTLPSRHHTVGTERRSRNILRALDEAHPQPLTRLVDLIRAAYVERAEVRP